MKEEDFKIENSIEERIFNELQELKKLTLISAKTALTVEDATFFTGLSKSHIYKLLMNNSIPHYKTKKLIYFDKGALTLWMLRNKVKESYDTI